MGFSPVPSEIKPVAHLMKLAEEHDTRNIVVAYWGMYIYNNFSKCYTYY